MAAIIFDLDDTLFDHARAMGRFLRAELGAPDDVVARLLAVDQRGKAPRADFCAAVAAELGLGPDMVWERIQSRLGAHVELEHAEIVERAAGRFEVAVLTNGGHANQTAKIRTLGLDRILSPERLLVSETLGARKPDPAAFAHALAAIGVEPRRAVFVGDDPVNDIRGARAAGMWTCWVARGQAFPDTPQPDWTIKDIGELSSVWDEFPT